MFALLVVVLFGILFSFFATQNTQGVGIQLFQYHYGNVPLYLIALISLLLGVFISWLLSVIEWASTSLTLHGKDMHIKKSEKAIEHLQQRIYELERKNALLQHEKEDVKEDAKEEIHDAKEEQMHRGSFFDHFRHKPAI